jgi:hypothetical protein
VAVAQSPLSLAQLTLLDVSPPALIEIAAQLRVQHVSIFVRSLARGGNSFPAVDTATMKREVLVRLRDLDVSVHNLEIFPIMPEFDLEAYRPALDMGASLGAKRADCID